MGTAEGLVVDRVQLRAIPVRRDHAAVAFGFKRPPLRESAPEDAVENAVSNLRMR